MPEGFVYCCVCYTETIDGDLNGRRWLVYDHLLLLANQYVASCLFQWYWWRVPQPNSPIRRGLKRYLGAGIQGPSRGVGAGDVAVC